MLNIHRSTVSRELKKNSGGRGYRYKQANEVSQALEVDFFFARPYRSCDQGLNEHTNGLVRQFLPKKRE